METLSSNTILYINEREFKIVKSKRLREGSMVLRSGDIYGRVGPTETAKAEQIHTESLFNRGFPVPEVLESGELPEGKWYFTEKSLGDEPFHKKFQTEYAQTGKVSNETFDAYLGVIERYAEAQVKPENRSSASATDFIDSLFTDNMVEWNYAFFGYSYEDYQRALKLATQRLESAPMGIIQHDLNPYNVLEGGVIDFELYGYGPIGYDSLISARWGGGWFTDYPSRYPVAYKLSREQIAKSDTLVDSIAVGAGLEKPSNYLEEFLLIKTAWSVSDFQGIDLAWPKDKIAFRQFRARLLHSAVESYLAGEPIDYWHFSSMPTHQISKK